VPSDYAKKKESTKVMRVRSSKGGAKEEVYYSEEENSETEAEEDEYVPEDDRSETGESHSDCSGSETEEANEETATHHVKPSKRKAESKKSSKMQKKPKTESEVKHRPSSSASAPSTSSKDEKKAPTQSSKPSAMFNDKNVDLDLFHSSPTNVVAVKVKVSPNMMVTSRNIDQLDGSKAGGQMYDFAALTFQRKMSNGKLFEFVMPLGIAIKVKQAIEHVVEKNKKFFKPQEV